MLPAEGQACPQSRWLVTFNMCFQSVMCCIGNSYDDSPAIKLAPGDLVNPSRVFSSRRCRSHPPASNVTHLVL